MPTALIDGIAAVADSHELFIVDQWGVLHNGHVAYPGAADALRALKAAGKTVVILSNSGKRPHTSYARMEELGLGRDLYDEVVTSGGQLYAALKAAEAAPYTGLGERVHVFAWGDDRGLLENLPYGEVATVGEADWILCAGAERGSVEAYGDDLRAARARDLPLFVANPDFVTVAPDGSLQLCPGSIARAYEEMGGTVHWHGKPTQGIYAMCRAAGGDGKAIGIGDSLHHDIAGAAGAGMASLLITQGIHKDELPTPMDAGAIAALAGRYNSPAPDFATPSFTW